jgi:hypothetical protein
MLLNVSETQHFLFKDLKLGRKMYSQIYTQYLTQLYDKDKINLKEGKGGKDRS